MLSPLPRHSGWAHYFAHSPSRISLPRYGSRVGLCIVLFEACSAFTRVTACTLAPSPIRDALSEGFSHFVTSIAAPVASGWSVCRVGLAPTGKRRLSTAHAISGRSSRCPEASLTACATQLLAVTTVLRNESGSFMNPNDWLSGLMNAHGVRSEQHDEWIVFPDHGKRGYARLFQREHSCQLDIGIEIYPGWL